MGDVEQFNIHNRDILKERAKRLSVPLEKPVGEQLLVLQFISQNRIYALEGAYICEVAPLLQMTPLPGVPPFVLGIVNIHGRIVAIMDLQTVLGIPVTNPSIARNVIILQGVASEFGFLADVIMGFVSIPLEDLQMPLPASSGAGVTYVESITIDGVAILAAEKLLLDLSLVVKQNVGSGP